MKAKLLVLFAMFLGPLLPPAAVAQEAGKPASVAERVSMLKQSLEQNRQALRTYQWIEKTTVSLNGEEKSQKQESCYYGADGALQKVPIAATPAPEKRRGLRGKIAEKKQGELTDTMKQAVGLVRLYVPPDPALIQKSRNAGKVSMEILQPGKLVRLVFRDYRLPGDALGVTVDVAKNQLAGLDVATYLKKPSNPVTLVGRFASLEDGTTYPATYSLAVKESGLGVAVANTGYRKMH